MKKRLQHWYCYLKQILGLHKDDYWDNNPFVIH